MSPEKSCINIFLDEQFSDSNRRLLLKLNELTKNFEINVPLLKDDSSDFEVGMCDSEWTDLLNRDRHTWIVLSYDRGKNKRKPRLPQLCLEKELHYIAFAKDIKGSIEQHRAIMQILPTLKKLSKDNNPRQYHLTKQPKQVDGNTFRLSSR